MGILKEVPHCPDKNCGNIETYYEELVDEQNNEEDEEENGGDLGENASTENQESDNDQVEAVYATEPETSADLTLVTSISSGRRDRKQIQDLELLIEKKGLGKKRARRQENSRYLCQLSDPQDTESASVLTPGCGSKFRLLFEDDDAFQAWNNFDKMAEEEQWEFLCQDRKGNRRRKHKQVKMVKERIVVEYQPTGIDCFENLTSKQKLALVKTNFPAEILRHLEDEISNFFAAHPNGIYISPPLSGFERLISHSIAAYHCLESTSIDDHRSVYRSVCIKSTLENYEPPPVSLSDYQIDLLNQKR